MKGYVIDIEKETLGNEDFRRVLYTTKNTQLVLMSLESGEEIGEEVHTLDQFLRFEQGTGKVILDGVEHAVKMDDAVVVPMGTKHNVINTGTEVMKLYTIYAPPEHEDQTVHHTKADAIKAEEHFDGKTSE